MIVDQALPDLLELPDTETTARTRRRLPGKLKIGVGIVLLFVLVGALAPLLTRHDPTARDVLNRLQPPSSTHWLGTDSNGSDVMSRLLHAIRLDLPLGFILAAIPCVIGTVVGALAGFSRRFLDTVVMRSADLVQAFPAYISILALVAILEPGVKSIVVAFALLGWVSYARLARGEVLRVREQEYVIAALGAGFPRRRVLARHVMPNVLNQTIVYFPADMLLSIVALAGLSFLGVGVQGTVPEWGRMIADGQAYVRVQPWPVVAPGLTLALLGLGLMLIADGLDDHLRSR
jgi:peptide/nickel transport system permease protein